MYVCPNRKCDIYVYRFLSKLMSYSPLISNMAKVDARRLIKQTNNSINVYLCTRAYCIILHIALSFLQFSFNSSKTVRIEYGCKSIRVSHSWTTYAYRQIVARNCTSTRLYINHVQLHVHSSYVWLILMWIQSNILYFCTIENIKYKSSTPPNWKKKTKFKIQWN